MPQFGVVHGDCLDVLPRLIPDSIDSCVTDPPYGLKFMGKGWDHGVPGVLFWEELLRAIKSGGHLLAFGGTRTHHRLMVAIEDAGWEIRDCLMWVYGSGFPKSHNLKGAWQGWGTALKPAWEPIILARKPLTGTVAANVKRYGVGGLNIDGCRVALEGDYKSKPNGRPSQTGLDDGYDPDNANQPDTVGRWPANLIHDGSDEVEELMPTNKARKMVRNRTDGARPFNNDGEPTGYVQTASIDDPGGSAARFFYCAKANKKDRGDANNHPTVKPTALMRYCCRLITPPGGSIIDPFCGSGSTGKAAVLESFNFIGIDREAEYVTIANNRIQQALEICT